MSVNGFCILKSRMSARVVLDSLLCWISIHTIVERGLFVGVRVHMSLDWISNSCAFLHFLHFGSLPLLAQGEVAYQNFTLSEPLEGGLFQYYSWNVNLQRTVDTSGVNVFILRHWIRCGWLKAAHRNFWHTVKPHDSEPGF